MWFYEKKEKDSIPQIITAAEKNGVNTLSQAGSPSGPRLAILSVEKIKFTKMRYSLGKVMIEVMNIHGEEHNKPVYSSD